MKSLRNQVSRGLGALILTFALIASNAETGNAAARNNGPAPTEESVDAMFFPVPLIPPCLQCRFTCQNATSKVAECTHIAEAHLPGLEQCLVEQTALIYLCGQCTDLYGIC